MIFSSIIFLFYFLPCFLLLYFFTPKKFKNGVLLLCSLLFFSWGAPQFVFVLLGITTIDFLLVRQMDKMNSNSGRKAILILSLCMNLGMLFYFKYADFFIENFNVLFQKMGFGGLPLLKVIMPLGISFFTFESITYMVDVYRRVHKPLKNFYEYQLYIFLFPKLIAGPIIRYHEIAGQITDRPDTIDDKLAGMYRFAIGLGKKVIIANYFAKFGTEIFHTNIAETGSFTAWMGALSYTFHIYFDFSGYSDMAIGIGRMMGFRFPENFNNPYTSSSITEFWRRWHITLGNWMRNYLYIPLGGNRVSQKRMYFNLVVVFVISGFWHGAEWTFIFWGLYHGIFLVLERVIQVKNQPQWLQYIKVVPTFVIVLIGWVIFNSPSLGYAGSFIKTLFAFRANGNEIIMTQEFYIYLIIAVFFSFITLTSFGKRIGELVFSTEIFRVRRHSVMTLGCFLLLVICAAKLSVAGFNPFIYFRF